MVDNVTFTQTGTTPLATNEIAGVHYQRTKLVWGVAGVAVDASATNPLPITFTMPALVAGGAAIGSVIANAGTNLNTTTLATLLGEVQTSPTVNTVLARLKDIYTAVTGSVGHDSPDTTFPASTGGWASAAAPTAVQDGDLVRGWHLLNGSKTVTLVSSAGAIFGGDATNGLDVDITRMAAQVAGEAHIGEFGGNSAVIGGTFTRPSDVVPYSIGDLVANSTTAGSVVPISCAVARKNAGTGIIRRVRLSKSAVGVTNASFKVHLYRTSPTVVNGDNGALSANGVAAIKIGAVDVVIDDVQSDGAKGYGACDFVVEAGAGVMTIFAIIEARAAYVPTSAEVFVLALEVLRD